MANSISHASLPYPIKNARFTLVVPFLDADGDPTDPTTPDTEVSQDGGAYADAAEEVTTVTGSNGTGYVTLTGAETNNSAVAVAFKVASGPKATLATLYPKNLAIVGSGTLSAGSAGGGTLGTILAYDVTGCFIRTTGGTGGGGTGGANNQARRIITYTPSTGAFTVSPNWETTPDNTTTYDVLLPEGVTLGMLKALNPATAGRQVVVDSSGLVDANTVKVGPTGSGTAQTARDIGASVLLSPGTGTGQVDMSSGVVKSNLTQCGGNAVSATFFAGITKLAEWLGLMAGKQTGDSTARTELRATGTGSGTFDETTDSMEAIRDGGDASWATVSAAGIRSAIGLASANLDTQLDALPTAAENAAAVWDLSTTGHTTAGTFGEAMQAAGSAGDPWATALPGAYGAGSAGYIVGTFIDAAVSSRSSHAAVDVWAVATRRVSDATNITSTGGTTVPQSGDSYTRLGAPAGASIAADIAAAKANLVSLLAIMGSITGTGVNTVLGFFKALLSKTATVPSDIGGTFDPSTDSTEAIRDAALTAANVNAEVVDALATDTYPEPSGVPAATSSLKDGIKWLVMLGRNKQARTASGSTVRNDGDSADVATATMSDDGTTFTRGKWT